MTNQAIGITGVFVVTFALLVLRHLFMSLGHPAKPHLVNRPHPRAVEESKAMPLDDDSWLLWTTDSDPPTGSPKPAGHV